MNQTQCEQSRLLDLAARLGRQAEEFKQKWKETQKEIKKIKQKRPFPVLALCGSTKYKREFEHWNQVFTLQGYVVFSVGVFGHADGITLTKEQKEQLDAIHRQKISMSDRMFVVNVEGYVGESTSNEILYAQSLGIPIDYLIESKQRIKGEIFYGTR